MAIYIIPKACQQLWDEWNLRGTVLFSLLLQILLIFLAGLRKRTRNTIIIAVVWLAYLMADGVAIFGIGLIVNKLSSECDKGRVSNNMAAFWAPFLLLHLGGPDSITAFSIEDNELWRRHFLGLISLASVVAYVVLLVIPNPFWIPSVLVFFSGIIKYGEHTTALYRASSDNFKKSIRSNGAIDFSDNRSLIDEVLEVKHGYMLYKFFQPLIADGAIVSSKKGEVVEKYISKLQPRRAFKILEVELNFMYDELFTKMAIAHQGSLSYFLRFTCTTLICAVLLLFTLHEKQDTHALDIVVSYTLLVGAVILDFLSLITLIFSNWTLVAVKNLRALRLIHSIQEKIPHSGRWTETIYQHSLIDECFKRCRNSEGWLNSVRNYVVFKDLLCIEYPNADNDLLKDIIFNHLKGKIGTTGEVVHQNRDRVVCDYVDKYGSNIPRVIESLSDKVEYGVSVLVWGF